MASQDVYKRQIMDSEPKAMDGSLYEAVDTKEKYVDVCLKRYQMCIRDRQ